MNSTRPTAARATSGPLRTQRTPLDRRGRNMTHRSPATGNFSFASHPRGHARRTTDRRDPGLAARASSSPVSDATRLSWPD